MMRCYEQLSQLMRGMLVCFASLFWSDLNFYIGKNLRNLPALRRIGFHANRRLLQVQRISYDCILAEETFQKLNRPLQVASQRTSALRFADPQIQALWRTLLLFQLLPNGFSNRDRRQHFAALLGQQPESLSPGQMSYHLRRLRLHGIIERIPKLIAIALPIPAYAPPGSAHEPTAASSAPDSGLYCPTFPHPTPGFVAASIDLIRRLHRGSNTQN
jgi:hypothetical protein